jgi:hypothetical protein
MRRAPVLLYQSQRTRRWERRTIRVRRVSESGVVPPIPESREVRDEQFWRDGAGFHWCWPKFNVYVPADKKRRAMLNRYPHNVIGAAVVLFGRVWGIRWKSSR